MSMNPVVTKLKEALASVGVATSNTQDAVLMAATTYIATISKPEKGDWVAPAPMILTSAPQLLGDLLAADEAKALAAARLEIAAEEAAKPKAQPKAKTKKAAGRVGR